MTAGGGVAYWPWLGLLGALVSDAKDRDSSSADQAARVNATHSELFDVLVEREKKVAELIAADKAFDLSRAALVEVSNRITAGSRSDDDFRKQANAQHSYNRATARRASALAALENQP